MRKSGAELIAAERQRQISEEGYTPLSDDYYDGDELAKAAACYAMPQHLRPMASTSKPMYWPWGAGTWKPTPDDRIRELVKAGALIAAEIDRLQRRS